ncbi:serine/threonine protein kinase [Streptomyces sp. Je 1-79]|uniref:serine/threonine-protein kinase n=1 Tax=Streptomyces sp. Je 1-79 TaxID=2943847 RepID=UPI0021A89F54|nr:serine/threonine-protein kinase [Streptomyces sp. Je 1-79]MCT4355462.1 serine/threonine protein kinase [Streptomyces sp. Je 1-79]
MRPLDASMPTEAGPYRLLTELGSGGMGRVFLGAAPDGRLAAVKQVHHRFAAEDGFRSRFRREVAASRKVSGAYTAAVMDADADAELPWLASVFVAGPSLGAAVTAAGPLPAETVRRLALGLVTALDEIHRADLIHRDLKPENVLLAEDGVRVIDFGIARAAEPVGATALTQTGWVIGSPPFMSPEQAESKELTPAGDVFSLGSVLTFAATGHAPFAAGSTFSTLSNVVHAEPDLSGVPDSLRTVVARCLAKDPTARPTPAELRGLLGPVTPATRPWPPAVHRLIADQRGRLDVLLGGGDNEERTSVPPPREPEPQPEPAHAAETVTATAQDPPPAPAHSARRGGRLVALVTAGALALAGAGVGTYLLLREGSNGPPDKYTKAPLCADAAPALPLPPRYPQRDNHVWNDPVRVTDCRWYDEDPVANWAAAPHAIVRWTVRHSAGANENAATRQNRDFDRDAAPPGLRDTTLDFGDEAYWDPSSEARECSLNVRDGNLVVWVSLSGERHPDGSCESEARAIAKTAVSETPTG